MRVSVSKIAALLTGLLGVVVILGWYLNLPFLIQMHPSFVPMQYNTALCFLLLGLSLFTLNFRKKRAVLPLAIIPLIIALVTLYEYYAMINLGIDELFMEHYIFVNTPFPGRMSLNTAVCFVIASVALIAAGINKRKFKYFVTVLGAAVLAAGVFSLIGYVTKYEFVYTWSHYSQMAVHTSTAFSFIGISILAFTLPRPKEEVARQFWLLYAAASFIFLFCILFILLMRNAERIDNRQLIASDAENFSFKIQNDLNDTLSALGRMSSRFSVSARMLSDVWYLDAENYLNDETTLNSIALIDVNMAVKWYLKKNEDGIVDQLNSNSEINDYITQLDLTSKQQTDLSNQVLIKKIDGLVFLLFPISRDSKISGWLLGVISFQKSLLPYIIQAKEQGYAFELRETDGTILFRSDNFLETKTELFQETDVQLGNNQWIIHFQETPDFYEIHTSYMQLVISISTGILLALLTWVILQYFRMQEQRRLVSRLYTRQSSALNVMIDGLVVISNKGIIQEVNRAALSMFGYERHELIDQNVKCLMPEPYRQEHDGYLQKYHNTGEQHIIGKGRILTAKRKDGSVFPINLQVTEGIDNGEKFYTGVIADLTEKLSIESKLAQKDAMLNAAVHSASAGFAIEDSSGKFIEVNDALCKWLGYSREEIIGKMAVDLVPKSEKKKALDIQMKLSSGKEDTIHLQKMYQRKDGETLWGLLSAAAVKNKEGNVVFVVKHIIDIHNEIKLAAEREKLIEKLEKSNSDLDQFAYVASHDLKSPLNAIQKIIGWLQDDCIDLLPEKSKEHLVLLKTRAQRMSQLLSDLLQYSQVSRYDYADDTVNLKAMVDDIVNLLQVPEGFSFIVDELDIKIPNIPLEIILRNLISNSIKHHDSDQGIIKVECLKEKNTYTIKVIDDGPGIPPDLHNKALEMFQTLKSRDKVEGSGMGLAIVKKIIEHYGGKLEIKSEFERGTSVIIFWPITSKIKER